MSKILITGHRGNLGERLNKRLLLLGYDVMGVDLKDGVDVADVSNMDSFKDVEVVFHLAAHIGRPKKNTIEACHGIVDFYRQLPRRVIYTSSAAIYNPQNLYGVHKLYGEFLFRQEIDEEDLTILRPFNIYGGKGRGLIDKIDKREHINVHGNGEQKRDYVHIEDVVDALVAALEHDFVGIADIGTGKSYSVNEVLKMADYADYTYVPRYGGVRDSVARLNPNLPWYARQELQTYFQRS